jgi:putative ABC transport system permease protein
MDAITKQVEISEESYTVIGVIENFISADPMRAGDPIIMLYRPESTYYAIVKTRPGTTANFLDELEKTWLSLNSLYSAKYQVFDDQLRENPLLIIFADFIKILSLVSGFSIMISCLGLLGMAMYSAENRVKEIGIRKVLGASVNNIILLLSREYLTLIGIALIIGIPLSWGINSLWMKVVTNKVGLSPTVFVIGALSVLVLAIITVGSQALRAARANSIDNLRSE